MTTGVNSAGDTDKCVVVLSFDNFGESFDLLKHGYAGGALADGAYAPRQGVPRILDLLDRYTIPATFFVEGWNAEKYSALVKDVVDRGHEVGAHGWMHEQWDALERTTEEELIKHTTHAIEKATGSALYGWRSPGGLITPNTLELLLDAGYRYDSSFGDEDVPYSMNIGSREIVEIPWCWSLDDAMYYSPSRPIANPNDIADQWIADFDAAAQMTGFFMLVCHPRFSGRPSRALALEKLIKHIQTSDKAIFKTCGAVAKEVAKQQSHPIYPAPEVYDRERK
jgi:peptidoglycan/xylan/chitin deacetylase (PgdA/CDA1 family)